MLNGAKTGPEMIAAQKATLDAIDKLSSVNKQLVRSALDSPDELFKALQGKVAGDGAQLKSAAKNKDIAGLAQGLVATKADLNDCVSFTLLIHSFNPP